MATTQDELQLNVKASDYEAKIGQLDAKMSELNSILGEYQTLKNDAVRVFGDDDDNLRAIQNQVQTNIDAVQGQYNMLKEARDMLQKQHDELGLLGQNIGQVIEDGINTAKSAFSAIKAVKEITG